MACTLKVTVVLFLAAATLVSCHEVTDRPGACKLSDIHVSVVRTGKTVSGHPEYHVTIDNKCSCAQASVRVRCGGLPSAELVDESKIRAENGGVCIVNDGKPIARGSPVKFNYAWNTQQSFAPTMAVPHC
ncbi:hypothetical protein PR202_ga21959 [Eleusine coracana subsp. coracana]|uniref:Uncharacterized protein n=1 Tax=Eleusine coracana subsp. coracana TaxID=191504 RepID=A0AAV5D0Z1_ELECO|nr:hypothetical protein QOZ80_9AG0682960 [Eleusine coracana subsp. coracana]GJN04412.1 hypothetical protein PR202_ga21959 [Eleusine coracana subsp. coracana]